MFATLQHVLQLMRLTGHGIMTHQNVRDRTTYCQYRFYDRDGHPNMERAKMISNTKSQRKKAKVEEKDDNCSIIAHIKRGDDFRYDKNTLIPNCHFYKDLKPPH